MAEMLGAILGPFGAYAYSVGFWAAVFASLLGVWQSVPYIYADFYSILKKDPEHVRREAIKVTSTRYRLALLFITLAPMPFAFIRRPLFIIVTYTIVGSLFIPFLAATLLYLNNRVAWTAAVPHNRWTTNALLFLILALFVGVGVQEIINALVEPFVFRCGVIRRFTVDRSSDVDACALSTVNCRLHASKNRSLSRATTSRWRGAVRCLPRERPERRAGF